MIVPNHERIEALRMALASVTHQNYPGTVHIYLVYQERSDIGPLLETLSPDVTPIAFRANDDRNPIAAKRNIGLDAASEELVALLDDDDVWHPMKLSLQVEALQQDTEAAAICTTFVPFTMQPTWPARPNPPRRRKLSQHAVLRGGAIVTSSLLFRARELDPLRFDERPGWQAVEDYDLKIQLRQSGRVWRVEAPLTGIRVANSSLSSVDRRSQHAKALSVLAASGRHGTDPWLRRLVALEGVPVAALAGEGAVSETATTGLAQALDGRLFGRLDPVVAAVIRKGWTSPRVASFAHAVRARLRARAAIQEVSSCRSAQPPTDGDPLRRP